MGWVLSVRVNVCVSIQGDHKHVTATVNSVYLRLPRRRWGYNSWCPALRHIRVRNSDTVCLTPASHVVCCVDMPHMERPLWFRSLARWQAEERSGTGRETIHGSAKVHWITGPLRRNIAHNLFVVTLSKCRIYCYRNMPHIWISAGLPLCYCWSALGLKGDGLLRNKTPK